jgi:hypothetical protein
MIHVITPPDPRIVTPLMKIDGIGTFSRLVQLTGRILQGKT